MWAEMNPTPKWGKTTYYHVQSSVLCSNHLQKKCSPSATELIGVIWGGGGGQSLSLYFCFGTPIDKSKMFDGHPRCVAQVSYTPLNVLWKYGHGGLQPYWDFISMILSSNHAYIILFNIEHWNSVTL